MTTSRLNSGGNLFGTGTSFLRANAHTWDVNRTVQQTRGQRLAEARMDKIPPTGRLTVTHRDANRQRSDAHLDIRPLLLCNVGTPRPWPSSLQPNGQSCRPAHLDCLRRHGLRTPRRKRATIRYPDRGPRHRRQAPLPQATQGRQPHEGRVRPHQPKGRGRPFGHPVSAGLRLTRS